MIVFDVADTRELETVSMSGYRLTGVCRAARVRTGFLGHLSVGRVDSGRLLVRGLVSNHRKIATQ